MTGLYVMAVAGLWIWVVFKFSRWFGAAVRGGRWRWPVAAVTFMVLLPLPVIDEIVGKRQFANLCKENTALHVDRVAVAGKTVYFEPQPSVTVAGTWVPIRMTQDKYVFATTGETAISFNTLEAKGGKVVQTFGFSEGRAPLLFRGSCGPSENVRALFKTLNITAQDRMK